MDLIDEEQRALPHATAAACRLESLLQIRDAGEDGRELFEMQLEDRGEQPRDGRLAGAWRAPEDHRGRAARRDHAAERALRRKQMILAHDFGELRRTQAVR